MNEDKVRELVEEAVHRARHTTEGNMCEEAIVQRVMEDYFLDGRWRSKHFLTKEFIDGEEPK